MAKFTPLTKEGENFIRTVCKEAPDSLLQGKNKLGVLPYCDPKTSPEKTWTSHAKDSAGNPIKTNTDLGESLIVWFNKYGGIYLMDANVMAAQAYAESEYYIWAYTTTSDASGISQFETGAIYDIIITNKYSQYCPPNTNMTPNEINAIIAGVNGRNTPPYTLENIDNKTNYAIYDLSTPLGRQNRSILHQNIIDNPEIMIKAQFRYMKFIATYHSPLTSNVLFGYSRGPAFVGTIYSDSINKLRNINGDVKSGVEYVFKIFAILGDKNNLTGGNPKGNPKTGIYFGYDDLGMNAPPSQQAVNFDKSNASETNVAESMIKYP